MSGRSRVRAVVWTGAFTAVTVVGAIYGAGMKTQREYNTARKSFVEATPEEQIALLEQRRRSLVELRRPLETKLETVRTRIRDREAVKERKHAVTEALLRGQQPPQKHKTVDARPATPSTTASETDPGGESGSSSKGRCKWPFS